MMLIIHRRVTIKVCVMLRCSLCASKLKLIVSSCFSLTWESTQINSCGVIHYDHHVRACWRGGPTYVTVGYSLTIFLAKPFHTTDCFAVVHTPYRSAFHFNHILKE